jgi:ATP-binding cassette, subfamily B (MDR/TAP), member 1
MWPFALLAIGCVPLMGFATSIEMKQMLGEDEGTGEKEDDDNNKSPGGVVVETLLNMRTVSALTLEQQRYKDYEKALVLSEPNVATTLLLTGMTGGISMFIQQWINALQLWFGGWLLANSDGKYEFKDFLISNFAVLFALFGLGAAFQDISDRKEVEKSAGRIFYLLDRVSEIDPLGKDGRVLSDATIHSKRSKFTKSSDDDYNGNPPAIMKAVPSDPIKVVKTSTNEDAVMTTPAPVASYDRNDNLPASLPPSLGEPLYEV